jgi:hypothetical protein
LFLLPSIAMTKTNTPTPKRREEGVAKLTVNPLPPTLNFMRACATTERDAATVRN